MRSSTNYECVHVVFVCLFFIVNNALCQNRIGSIGTVEHHLHRVLNCDTSVIPGVIQFSVLRHKTCNSVRPSIDGFVVGRDRGKRKTVQTLQTLVCEFRSTTELKETHWSGFM